MQERAHTTGGRGAPPPFCGFGGYVVRDTTGRVVRRFRTLRVAQRFVATEPFRRANAAVGKVARRLAGAAR